jgi:chromosome segregation ATPase
MTTDQITLHLCEVIAEQKEKINQLESSNKYLRTESERKEDSLNVLGKKYAQQHKLLDEYAAEKNEAGDIIQGLNNQIAEQKVTNETLQKTVQSLSENCDILQKDFTKIQSAYNEACEREYELETKLNQLTNGK